MEDDISDSKYVEYDGQVVKNGNLTASQLFKPPDDTEMSLLRDSDSSYISVNKLQASALAKETLLSIAKRKKIDEYLDSLCEIITKLPVLKRRKLMHCHKVFDDVKIPFLMDPYRVKGDMVFSPSVNVQVVGSYPLMTCLKNGVNVDIVLEMPKECIQEKDFLNQRYLRKRAVYLSYIAHYLKGVDIVSSVKFSFFMDDHQKPVLLLTPSGKLSKYFMVTCHVCPPKDSIKPERFLPSKSNVRQSWFNGVDINEAFRPTPHYNSLILSDVLLLYHQEQMENVLLNPESKNICDAIKLLKIWLQQRELGQGQGSFSGFLLTMVVLYLIKLTKINSLMTSYQVVRNVLLFLSTSNWMESGISMGETQDLSEFREHFEVVFVGPTGHLNLCFDLSTPVYKQVRREAGSSLKTLDNTNILNSFEALFITSAPFMRSYDHFLRINRLGNLRGSCKKIGVQDRLAEFNGNALSCTFDSLTSCLERGLNSRITLMSCRGCQYGSWEVNRDAPNWKSPESFLTYGFLLSSEASRIIEKGPASGTPEANDFRQFWGDKSDLRQFKDGAICEAVVWDCKNVPQKRNLPEKLSKHLLSLHFGLPASSLTYIGPQIENVLHPGINSLPEKPKGCLSIGDENSTQLDQAFNELCSQLRNLKDLPLAVVSTTGISAALRHTDVFPPNQVVIEKNPRFSQGNEATLECSTPNELICLLESSGKWPQDIEALRRIKASFHVKIAEDLKKSDTSLFCIPSQEFVDVIKDGFVFRITVSYPRELAISKTFAAPNGLIKSKLNALSMKIEEKTVHLPKLAYALKCISQRNDAFGLTCRLAKHWVNGHMLSNHMPEIVTELLCAYLFTSSQPYSEPRSSLTGFHRFLWLLSDYDFAANPIIVDFDNEILAEDAKQIEKFFKENRDSLPAIYIATSIDKAKSTLTFDRPSPIIVNRLKTLSLLSLKKLGGEIHRSCDIVNILPIFASSTSVYDVVIHLDPNFSTKIHKPISGRKRKFNVDNPVSLGGRVRMAGFNPVQYYLNDLMHCHSEVALFFVNQSDGSKIGVLWKSWAFADQDFKIGECLNRYMISEKKVGRDINAIVEDFRILGDGLVSEIELHPAKWKLQ